MTGALLAAAAASILVDQVSKSIAHRLLAESDSGAKPGFNWVLNQRGGLVPVPVPIALALWLAALGVAVAVVAHGPERLAVAAVVGVGLVLGGAAGNLVDRVRRGAVSDFIAVWRWPPFNLADASMVVGTILLAGALV